MAESASALFSGADARIGSADYLFIKSPLTGLAEDLTVTKNAGPGWSGSFPAGRSYRKWSFPPAQTSRVDRECEIRQFFELDDIPADRAEKLDAGRQMERRLREGASE